MWCTGGLWERALLWGRLWLDQPVADIQQIVGAECARFALEQQRVADVIIARALQVALGAETVAQGVEHVYAVHCAQLEAALSGGIGQGRGLGKALRSLHSQLGRFHLQVGHPRALDNFQFNLAQFVLGDRVLAAGFRHLGAVAAPRENWNLYIHADVVSVGAIDGHVVEADVRELLLGDQRDARHVGTLTLRHHLVGGIHGEFTRANLLIARAGLLQPGLDTAVYRGNRQCRVKPVQLAHADPGNRAQFFPRQRESAFQIQLLGLGEGQTGLGVIKICNLHLLQIEQALHHVRLIGDSLHFRRRRNHRILGLQHVEVFFGDIGQQGGEGRKVFRLGQVLEDGRLFAGIEGLPVEQHLGQLQGIALAAVFRHAAQRFLGVVRGAGIAIELRQQLPAGGLAPLNTGAPALFGDAQTGAVIECRGEEVFQRAALHDDRADPVPVFRTEGRRAPRCAGQAKGEGAKQSQ